MINGKTALFLLQSMPWIYTRFKTTSKQSHVRQAQYQTMIIHNVSGLFSYFHQHSAQQSIHWFSKRWEVAPNAVERFECPALPERHSDDPSSVRAQDSQHPDLLPHGQQHSKASEPKKIDSLFQIGLLLLVMVLGIPETCPELGFGVMKVP